MGWARMDDGFDDHPKVLALLDEEHGLAAIGLWTLVWTYAHRTTRKRGKTPGLIPASLPRRYAGPAGRELAALLVKVGLWDVLGDGWQIHDFGDYLPTEETSAKRAEAGRRGAARRWASDGNGMATAWQDDGTLPSPDSTLPSSGGNSMANDGSRAPARRDPTPVPTPVPTKTASSKKTIADDDPDFAAFWKAYPRRTDKGHARTAWPKAIAKAAAADIIAGAQRFAEWIDSEGKDRQFIPHPATWLNGERWSDEHAPARASPNGHRAYHNPTDDSVYDEGLWP